MAHLKLRFLGDLEVVRDGAVQPLPPSKKTRALLAWLALNPRPHRRERLCELLWHVPDDPRGSLRWSLSKLRRLVDDDDRVRIVADRNHVGFDATDVDIDVNALLALPEALETSPLDALERAASASRGNFLEGLELANLHDFHAWCIGAREGAAQARARVLEKLIARLAAEPGRALPWARELVGLVPYDEPPRATLIRLLVAAGRPDEAEQQYRLGLRMLEEVRSSSTGALFRAWRGEPGAAAPQPPARSASRPAAFARGDLVGRTAELERIAALLADSASGPRARVLLVRGDPGIGKTRLMEAAGALAAGRGARVLNANAYEAETIRPFALWIDALAGSAINDPFGRADHGNRDRLFGELSVAIATLSAAAPLVLLFDDVQWCDESSAAALHYVVRTNRDAPLLVLLAARDAELRDNAAVQQASRSLRREGLLEELRLEALPAAHLRELIERRAPRVDSERLCKAAGGNPLLAIELARAEAEGEDGTSLDELVRERLARFDVEGGEVLRWAAILTPRIDVGSLARATGLDPSRVATALEQAESGTMLRRDERGTHFSHNLIARSIYRDIPPARRQVMHRRAAELLERDTARDLALASDLAHHALHSGDPALAARALVSAGRLCLRFFANDEAQTLARRGLLLARELAGAERVCLTLELSDVLLTAAPVDDWQAAAEELASLAEQALDHGAHAHARLGYQMASWVRWANGHWAGAREASLQAERVARSGSAVEHIVGMAETAKCLAMLERDLSEADAMLMEAQALAKRSGVRPHPIPAALGMLRFHENSLDEAEELFKEARTLCKAEGDRVNEFQANEYLVMIDFERGCYAAARRHCSALLDIGARLRGGSEAPFARALDGLCHYALADSDDPLDGALEDLRAADAKHRLAYTLTRAALIDLERGRIETGRARATEALECATVLERATETALAHFALASAFEAAGDRAGRRQHLDAIAALDSAPVARWAAERVRSARLRTTNP